MPDLDDPIGIKAWVNELITWGVIALIAAYVIKRRFRGEAHYRQINPPTPTEDPNDGQPTAEPQ